MLSFVSRFITNESGATAIEYGLIAAGIAVAIGGFHVSGCLSMLDGHAVQLDACREMGISIFAGEAEGRRSADEITAFDSTGLAIQDLAIALAAYEQAAELDLPQVDL